MLEESLSPAGCHEPVSRHEWHAHQYNDQHATDQGDHLRIITLYFNFWMLSNKIINLLKIKKFFFWPGAHGSQKWFRKFSYCASPIYYDSSNRTNCAWVIASISDRQIYKIAELKLVGRYLKFNRQRMILYTYSK